MGGSRSANSRIYVSWPVALVCVAKTVRQRWRVGGTRCLLWCATLFRHGLLPCAGQCFLLGRLRLGLLRGCGGAHTLCSATGHFVECSPDISSGDLVGAGHRVRLRLRGLDSDRARHDVVARTNEKSGSAGDPAGGLLRKHGDFVGLLWLQRSRPVGWAIARCPVCKDRCQRRHI